MTEDEALDRIYDPVMAADPLYSCRNCGAVVAHSRRAYHADQHEGHVTRLGQLPRWRQQLPDYAKPEGAV